MKTTEAYEIYRQAADEIGQDYAAGRDPFVVGQKLDGINHGLNQRLISGIQHGNYQNGNYQPVNTSMSAWRSIDNPIEVNNDANDNEVMQNDGLYATMPFTQQQNNQSWRVLASGPSLTDVQYSNVYDRIKYRDLPIANELTASLKMKLERYTELKSKQDSGSILDSIEQVQLSNLEAEFEKVQKKTSLRADKEPMVSMDQFLEAYLRGDAPGINGFTKEGYEKALEFRNKHAILFSGWTFGREHGHYDMHSKLGESAYSALIAADSVYKHHWKRPRSYFTWARTWIKPISMVISH